MTIWRKSVLFYLGGCAYVALELLFRGRSHGSMFLAGGICLLLVGQLSSRLPLMVRALAGALIITAVELFFGLLVNRAYTVWDYRSLPGNLWGQICPGFSVLWIGAALLILLIYAPLEKEIRRRSEPSA